MISVTFDSNLIQKVLAPDEYKDDPEYDLLKEIHLAIISGRIVAFVSEMYFTQETLRRRERISAFSRNASGGVSIQQSFTGSVMHIQLTLGPAPSAHVRMNHYQAHYIEIMRKLGIKVLKTYRLGDFVNDDLISSDFYVCPSLPLSEVQQRNDDCCKFIENELYAGKHLLDIFLSNYPGRNIYEKSKYVPDDLNMKFAELVAEMADGQSIAISYANDIDYFCTRDEASSAGQASVLSSANREKLVEKYQIRIINLSDLAQKVREDANRGI